MQQTRQSNLIPHTTGSQGKTTPQRITSFAQDLQKGESFPFHEHQSAQLVYASHGLLKVTTHEAVYIVPPQRAVWMPNGIEHRIDVHEAVAMRSLYIEPSLIQNQALQPRVIMISPLLRELILTAIAIGNEYAENSPESRIMDVILDQITEQSGIALALPLPKDSRLLIITRTLIDNPADTYKLEDWVLKVGASKRTINRLFMQQTQMSFQSWRQQLRLHQGIELLTAGQSVTQVALSLGYRDTSSFIAMFRRCLGVTPTDYLRACDRN